MASPNIVLPSGTQAAQSDAPQLPSPGTSTSQAASSTAKTKRSSKNNSSTKASTESKPGTINEKFVTVCLLSCSASLIPVIYHRQVHLRCYLEVHGQDALLSDWEKAYKADRKDPAKLTVRPAYKLTTYYAASHPGSHGSLQALRADVEQAKKVENVFRCIGRLITSAQRDTTKGKTRAKR